MSSLNNLVRGKKRVSTQLFNRITEIRRLDSIFYTESSVDALIFKANERDSFGGLADGRLCKVVKISGDVFTVKVFEKLGDFQVSTTLKLKQINISCNKYIVLRARRPS